MHLVRQTTWSQTGFLVCYGFFSYITLINLVVMGSATGKRGWILLIFVFRLARMTITLEIDTDFEVSVSENGQFIIIDIKGPITNDLGRRCGIAGVELGQTTAIKCYLFDLRGAPNVENTLANYKFAYEEISDFGFPKDTRSALLTDPGDRSHEFMETVFMNAGYVVRLFTDEMSAISWLNT